MEAAKVEPAATSVEQQSDAVLQVLEVAPPSHPFAFHVSGPRNVAVPNWREIISSSWKDDNYKRAAIACFIQAVYLLELDRQENRTPEEALAPTWWTRFKYKLTETLIDERDGSIFGAILEWDRSAALSDMILIRPSGAPRAVLALRGTILKGPTMKRDIQDDLRFLAWESLKGSVRFHVALKALRTVAERHGGGNVCVAGHSLGAGFALQVGKALAKEGIFVDAHLFNPPSISLAMGFRNVGEKVEFAWKRFKAMLPYSSESSENSSAELQNGSGGFRNWISSKTLMGSKKWVPHLYVNNSDYICCHYSNPDGNNGGKNNGNGGGDDKENANSNGNGSNAIGQVSAKLFVMAKEKQKFLEAHGLEQWWSDDAQGLKSNNPNSKLMSRQLKSLYSLPAQPTQSKIQ
ncbi:GDSL esterase/lipase At4g10955 [Linum grandiflorum]